MQNSSPRPNQNKKQNFLENLATCSEILFTSSSILSTENLSESESVENEVRVPYTLELESTKNEAAFRNYSANESVSKLRLKNRFVLVHHPKTP